MRIESQVAFEALQSPKKVEESSEASPKTEMLQADQVVLGSSRNASVTYNLEGSGGGGGMLPPTVKGSGGGGGMLPPTVENSGNSIT